MERADIAIIGTGPGGVSAALTAKVRNKNILLIGKKQMSDKVSKAHQIMNYPGLPAVTGADMAKAFEKQLAMMEIDELGLDAADRQLLTNMLSNYGDRPVGLTTIAALTGDEATTIEDFYEPYLMQIGFIERTPRGRRVTPKAATHLGKKASQSPQEKLL